MEGSGCYGHNGADDVGGRRGAARARPARPAGARAVDARGRAQLGAVRPGHGDRRARRARRARHDRGLALRGLEQHALHAARRAPATCCRPASRRAVPAAAAASRCRSRKAAATATPSRSTRCRTRASCTTSCPTMPLRVSALRGARRLHERVLDRELHGRAGAPRRAPTRSSSGCGISTTRARATWCTPAAERFGWTASASAARAAAAASPSRATRTSPPTAAIACEVEVERETGACGWCAPSRRSTAARR